MEMSGRDGDDQPGENCKETFQYLKVAYKGTDFVTGPEQ